MTRSRVLRRIRVVIERAMVMVLLWGTSLVPWWWLMRWEEAGRKAAAKAGVFIEPGELTLSLPFWFLIVAYYLAGPIVARLERFWERRGW